MIRKEIIGDEKELKGDSQTAFWALPTTNGASKVRHLPSHLDFATLPPYFRIRPAVGTCIDGMNLAAADQMYPSPVAFLPAVIVSPFPL
jgi:hypothetical protein